MFVINLLCFAHYARPHKKEEEGVTRHINPAPSLFVFDLLFAEVESLDDCAVTLDVNLLQVLQQLATLTYEAQQRTLRSEVVLVAFEVLRKVADTVRKQRDLALWRTGVGVRLSVLAEKLLLFFC